MGSGEVETRYDRPISYGIRRCEFDAYLLDRSGARLRQGEPVATLARSGLGWIVNEAYEAPLLIGAGGHYCPVARWLGHQPRLPEHPVTAQEIEFQLDEQQQTACRIEQEMPELFFCRDLLGYGWCFRKGDYLNIGLGRLVPCALAEHVTRFHEFLVSRRSVPPGIRARYRGHAYLVRCDSHREPLADGVLLVGDSAGLAYAESGEGIRPAIESALLVAQTVTAARGRYGRDDLEPYRLALESRFGPARRQSGPIASLPAGLKAWVGGFLLGLPWFARKVVMENWFLHSHDPHLPPNLEPTEALADRETPLLARPIELGD
jgi:flavin-dependent dehydrogenase